MCAPATEQAVRLSGRISDRLYSWGTSLGGSLLLILILVLFQSIFWAAHVPLALKLGIAALGVLSVFRPADGLLVVAGLAPLGYMLTTRVFAAYPARITEAIVLAFFAGYALRIALTRLARRPGGKGTDPRTSDADSRPLGPPSNLLTPALLFSAIVVASCVVHYHVVQAWHDHPWPFFQRFLDFLVWGYHDAIGNIDPTAKLAGFGFVITTAFVLEGTALLLSAFTLCARDPGLRGRLVTMVVAGAVGASALSFVRLAMAVVGEVDPIASLPGLLADRWTMFTPKLNTAASLFVLVAPLALAAAAARTGRRSGSAKRPPYGRSGNTSWTPPTRGIPSGSSRVYLSRRICRPRSGSTRRRRNRPRRMPQERRSAPRTTSGSTRFATPTTTLPS